jgi:hypothetical protein
MTRDVNAQPTFHALFCGSAVPNRAFFRSKKPKNAFFNAFSTASCYSARLWEGAAAVDTYGKGAMATLTHRLFSLPD